MGKDPNAVALGRKGGEATKKKMGEDHYRRMARLSIMSRRRIAEEKKEGLEIIYAGEEELLEELNEAGEGNQ
jgi:hypothetical protein